MPNYNWNTSSQPATGSIAMYTFLATALLAGWTDTKDSDGTTYAPAGGQVTSGNAGAHGLGNNSAWFVISNGTAQYCVQRGTTNQVWRIKYSPLAGFSGGAPGATQVPSATDETVFLGGGTDAAPTFANLFPADNTYRYNVACGKVVANWAFWMVTWTLGNAGSTGMAWSREVMTAGTYPTTGGAGAGDTDPVAHYLQPSSAGQAPFAPASMTDQGTNVKASFWSGAAMVYQSAGLRPYYDVTDGRYAAPGQSGGNGNDGVNSFTGKDELLPVYWGRNALLSAPNGPKGIGSMGYFDTVFRANADTVSVASPTAKDFIYLSGMCLPWDGTSPVI
jgi:hypothetical protein